MDLADKNNKKGFCRKKISVIIPVYNAEKYIRETLDSIIKQSYENWEIILVENGKIYGDPYDKKSWKRSRSGEKCWT